MRANRLWPRQKRARVLYLAVFGLVVWSYSSAIPCAAAGAGHPAPLDDLIVRPGDDGWDEARHPCGTEPSPAP